MARLFFALPATPVAAAIAQWRATRPWPGALVPAANFHLTLAFLGQADERQTEQLMAQASRLHCPPLTLSLDSCGWFARAKAAWIGPKQWPNELAVFARALQRLGRQHGLGHEEAHFHPHITLSRKAAEAPAPAPAPALLLRAEQFCLYQSVSTPSGVRYEPLACWPLHPRVAA